MFLLVIYHFEPFYIFTVANALWVHINQLNQSLAQTLLHLSKLYEQDKENYESAVKYLSSLQPVQVNFFTPPIYFYFFTRGTLKSGLQTPGNHLLRNRLSQPSIRPIYFLRYVMMITVTILFLGSLSKHTGYSC